MIIRCLGRMLIVSRMETGVWMPGDITRTFTPQKNWMAERSISITPKEAMTSMIVGALRSGL